MPPTKSLKLDQVKPDPKNANKGTKKGRKLLSESLAKHGAGRSILLDKHGVAIAGNKTLEEAKAQGFDRVRVVQTTGRELVAVQRMDLDLAKDPSAKQLAILDNRVAELDLSWDEGVLAQYAEEGILGSAFSERELAALLAGKRPEGTATDEAPDTPEVATTQLGDVIQLGAHRLVCGDSTRAEVLERALAGVGPVDCIWTDPPYNVAYEGKTADALTIQNDAMSAEKFWQFLRDAHQRMFEALKPGGSIYVAHSDSWGHLFRNAFIASGLLLKECLIWAQDSFVMGRQDYQWQHEPLLYGFKEAQAAAADINSDPFTHTPIIYGWRPGSHGWYSDRKQSTILSFARPKRSSVHPTMKPVMLVEYCILNSTPKGGLVFDGFGGSGTTLMACESADRRCVTVELDPKYCDVIVSRWEAHTGRQADRPVRP